MRNVAIIGTVGLPAKYGGFETLAENLVKFNHENREGAIALTVYCSGNSYKSKTSSYLSASLRYIPLNANGVSSIAYDVISLFSAVFGATDCIILHGTSGAIALPFIRLISPVRVIVNIDGMEWRRSKWNFFARTFLKMSEGIAVKYSDAVIADNEYISQYVNKNYNLDCHLVEYGGDHAIVSKSVSIDDFEIPLIYAISICRIEPENNIHMILEAFSDLRMPFLVFVGNWSSSDYGIELKKIYLNCSNLMLLDPIYDLGKLHTLRSNAMYYIHGHSAGGTNPSLVEAMHFGKPVIAFDCEFNRCTTENKAIYFKSAEMLCSLISGVSDSSFELVGENMIEIAQRRYKWSKIAEKYFQLIDKI